jgi:hypothetical protein
MHVLSSPSQTRYPSREGDVHVLVDPDVLQVGQCCAHAFTSVTQCGGAIACKQQYLEQSDMQGEFEKCVHVYATCIQLQLQVHGV